MTDSYKYEIVPLHTNRDLKEGPITDFRCVAYVTDGETHCKSVAEIFEIGVDGIDTDLRGFVASACESKDRWFAENWRLAITNAKGQLYDTIEAMRFGSPYTRATPLSVMVTQHNAAYEKQQEFDKAKAEEDLRQAALVKARDERITQRVPWETLGDWTWRNSFPDGDKPFRPVAAEYTAARKRLAKIMAGEFSLSDPADDRSFMSMLSRNPLRACNNYVGDLVSLSARISVYMIFRECYEKGFDAAETLTVLERETRYRLPKGVSGSSCAVSNMIEREEAYHLHQEANLFKERFDAYKEAAWG